MTYFIQSTNPVYFKPNATEANLQLATSCLDRGLKIGNIELWNKPLNMSLLHINTQDILIFHTPISVAEWERPFILCNSTSAGQQYS